MREEGIDRISTGLGFRRLVSSREEEGLWLSTASREKIEVSEMADREGVGSCHAVMDIISMEVLVVLEAADGKD